MPSFMSLARPVALACAGALLASGAATAASAGVPATVPASVAALPASIEFIDVSADASSPYFSEHAEAIDWAQDLGIVRGWTTPAGVAFRPEDLARRDAVAAFLYRWAGEPDLTFEESAFVDVSSDPESPLYSEHWRAITWMYEWGLSEGWEDGTYRPRETVTRDAVATFVHRMFGEPPAIVEGEGFVDVSDAEGEPTYSEHAAAIAWLDETGIARGWDTPAGAEFRPVAPIKRDAIAAFLYRAELYALNG